MAPYELPPQYNRKSMRSMGPVAVMSTRATELALEDAGLIGDPVLTSGRTGIAYGACAGSAESTVAFGRMATSGSLKGVTSNTYVQMMSHTGAVNISLFFGITGRIIPSSSACTSGSQAIGFAYETIKYGKQAVMIAGGADELSLGSTAVFDTLFATSTTQRRARDHAHGPSTRSAMAWWWARVRPRLILEDLEHAQARGARIYAEVVGFGSNADGAHITQPQMETMARGDATGAGGRGPRA